MFNIYEDIIENVGQEDTDNYESLRNDTNRLSWLNITPQVNESINHIIHVSESGSENPGSQDKFSDVDLESHSTVSTVYTRPTPRCRNTTVRVTANSVQYSTQSAPIKIKHIVIEVTIITLILILISHISCLQTIRKQTEDDILKSDKVTWKLYEKLNINVQDPVQDPLQDPIQDPVLTPLHTPSNKGAGGQEAGGIEKGGLGAGGQEARGLGSGRLGGVVPYSLPTNPSPTKDLEASLHTRKALHLPTIPSSLPPNPSTKRPIFTIKDSGVMIRTTTRRMWVRW